MPGDVEIRELRDDDLDAVVELAVRAWAPVFASLRKVLGDAIFFRLNPDWREDQANAAYESFGFTALPGVRYLKLIGDESGRTGA